MRSPLDAARYRLSAVHPSMSHMEQERASSRIASDLTPQQLDEECKRIFQRVQALRQECQQAELQLTVLHRAYEFQRRKSK